MQDASFGVIPIRREDNVVLLVKTLEGKWGFPKGHSEQNETPRQTALRELAEETGITKCTLVENITFTEHYHFEKGGVPYNKTNQFFIGFIDDPTVHIQQEELLEAQWLDYARALKQLSFPDAKRILEEVLLYIKENMQYLA